MERNSSYNYSFADIDRYVSGIMSAAEMHDIERAALQDPFLADAIDGYREKDSQQSQQHLNEITAALQGVKSESRIIAMPKKRNYAWLIAASSIAVIGISIFFLTQSRNNETSAPLAQNKVRTEEKVDTISDSKNAPAAPLSQDLNLTAPESASSPKQKATANKPYKAEKKETPLSNRTILQAAPAETTSTVIPGTAGTDNYVSKEKADKSATEEPRIAMMDTSIQQPQAASVFAKRAKVAPANSWTTDKGKPFILSEVEEFQVGRKDKKITDTAAIKPEGGWQSFQEYLFSKLNKRDTADFNNAARFDGTLELEFSLTNNGSPYNIKILRAQDSATAKTAAAAVQGGPKWISDSKKAKRLNIRY